MAKRWYTKDAVYVLPKGNLYAPALDGIYINADLFENNIPVQDCVLWITIQPRSGHSFVHKADFGVPSFQAGQVIRLSHEFWWSLGQSHSQAAKIHYNGNPYGMGLNTIAVEMRIDAWITRDVVYDVSYIMEVDV